MTFGTTFEEHLTMVASANMFYIAIDYKNKANMKVVASNLIIKIHKLFSKGRILSVWVTIAQWKFLGKLLLSNVKIILVKITKLILILLIDSFFKFVPENEKQKTKTVFYFLFFMKMKNE